VGHQEVLNTPRLILISDSRRLPADRFFDTVEAALSGGVDCLLVREKQMDSARLLAFSSKLRDLTSRFDAKLIIHTQADIAKAVGADGVHLSSTALNEIPQLRQWLGSNKMTISASCHNEIELGFAGRFGADYALLSPLFPTASHPGEPSLGIDKFNELANTTPLPVVALGGITAENRHELGGFGVAVISAILDAENPGEAATSLLA